MSKRKSIDDENKENLLTCSPSHKKTRLETLEAEIGRLKETFSQRISQIENFLSNLNVEINAFNHLKSENITENLNNDQTIVIAESQAFSSQSKDNAAPPEIETSHDKIDELLGILSQSKELNHYVNNGKPVLRPTPVPQGLYVSFYDIIQMGGIFPSEYLIRKLKEFILEKLKPNDLKTVLQSFIYKDFTNIKSPDLIIDLVEYRLNWLEDFCRNIPVFSWRMSSAGLASDSNNPQTNKFIEFFKWFLESKQINVYYHCGVGIGFARSLISDYAGLRKTYSVSMLTHGVGKDTVLLLEKNNIHFNQRLKEHNSKNLEFKKEITSLKKFTGKYFK